MDETLTNSARPKRPMRTKIKQFFIEGLLSIWKITVGFYLFTFLFSTLWVISGEGIGLFVWIVWFLMIPLVYFYRHTIRSWSYRGAINGMKKWYRENNTNSNKTNAVAQKIVSEKDNDHGWYIIGAFITGIIAFIAIWIYAIVSWGFLIGLAIGWLPAIIGAFIIGAIWPLIALLLIGIIILFLVFWNK